MLITYKEVLDIYLHAWADSFMPRNRTDIETNKNKYDELNETYDELNWSIRLLNDVHKIKWTKIRWWNFWR